MLGIRSLRSLVLFAMAVGGVIATSSLAGGSTLSAGRAADSPLACDGTWNIVASPDPGTGQSVNAGR